jgi:hypothetical protein
MSKHKAMMPESHHVLPAATGFHFEVIRGIPGLKEREKLLFIATISRVFDLRKDHVWSTDFESDVSRLE